MNDPEQSHSDDMNVLNYLLRTVKGLRAVSTDNSEFESDDPISYS